MYKIVLPYVFFVITLLIFAFNLNLTPKEIASPLISNPAPHFRLPLLSDPSQMLQPEQLHGRVWLLNIWSSWCEACPQESKLLTGLAHDYPELIVGLNYRDDPDSASQWLTLNGNPYSDSVLDLDGTVGIEYGVYEIPQTYIIDKKGIIRFKHSGVLNEKDLQEKVMPLLHILESEALKRS